MFELFLVSSGADSSVPASPSCVQHTLRSVCMLIQVKTPFPCFQSLTASGAEMYVKIDFSSIMHSVAVSGEG